LPPDDRIRIQHMIEAAESALEFVSGRSRGDLETDRMLLFALIRAIEIVGEAASRVSPETRQAIKEIPWPAVIGMRNRLVHAYFDINYDTVWKTATDELSDLLPRLRATVNAQ
jgi:uncharacterized protein with HEPN domain